MNKYIYTLKLRIKPYIKNIYQTDFVRNIISSLLYVYTRLVYKTTKWQIINREKMINLWENDKPFILVGWHGRALMYPAFRDYRYPLNALVSLHKDGRIIAGVLQKYGLGTIGGSSNNNAKAAALNLMNSLKENTAICIIPDGPRGPRMHMTDSPIYYAHKTGLPIIGITYSVKKCKIIEKSWDKMMIPYPFNKGICRFSDPIYIPTDASEEELEKYRQQIEDMLNQHSFEADTAMGLKPILPGTESKKKNDKK